MKLYYDPVAITCRPIMLFLAEHSLPIELARISLLDGEHLTPAFEQLNPDRAVPLLVNGDFRLTQSSAILKFLATEAGSPLYPTDSRSRALVNARMDWIMADFYPHFGHGFVHPQVIESARRPNEQAQLATLEWGLARSRERLRILDTHILGSDRRFLCGEAMSIADYLALSVVTSGEWVGFDYGPYPNIVRWLATMKQRPAWGEVNAAFAGMAAALASARV